MGLREIREQLGRVKHYYLRNDMLRALTAAVMGVKGIVDMGGQPSTDIRGILREAVQLLSRDEQIKNHLQAPLMYQPGNERRLLVVLADIYKRVKEASEREDFDAAMARKQNLDHAFNLGMTLLRQGQVSEADASFAKATASYKDEHRVFMLIGRALLEAGEVRRAIPYLKRASEVDSEDREALLLLQEALKQRTQE